MRRLLVAAMLLCCAFGAGAQSKKSDSLRLLLLRPVHDTVYYRALAGIADQYKSAKPDSAIIYGNKVLAAPDEKKFFRIKASAYNAIGYAHYFTSAYKTSIEDFKNYYGYAAKAEDKSAMAYALNNEGNVYIELGDYATALERYRQALDIRQRINDTKGIAMSYNNIGFVYKELGDFDKAVSNFLTAIRELERLGDKRLIASSYNSVGIVYIRKKDFAQAIAFQEKALALQRETDDIGGQGVSLQMIANAYMEQSRLDEAQRYNQAALELYQKTADLRQISLVEGNIGEVYLRLNQFATAIPHLQESIRLQEQSGNRRSLAIQWMGMAEACMQLSRLPEARLYLDSATALIAQTKNKISLKALYELEAKYHAAAGDFKTALAFSFRFASQKDTLLNEANVKAMSDMSVKYETEKKEAQIALMGKESAIRELQLKNQRLQLDEQLFHLAQDKLQLSQADLKIANGELQIRSQNEIILSQKLEAAQRAARLDSLHRKSELQAMELRNRRLELRQRNAVISALGLLMLLGGMLSYSYYRRAQLKAAARMHSAILRQQEEATRAVLEAEEAERSRIAKDLHDGVGQMMSAAKMNLSAYEHDAAFASPDERIAFERIIHLVDESCKEVRAVSHNMMPNALLKNSLAAAVREFINQIDQRKLKVHLYTEGLDQRLDANIETVLYRVIQECVNNVIKHSGANTLDISIVKEAGEITATVEDNGKGFDLSGKADAEGIGLKNIRTRVDYLKGSVDFDSAPGRGTVVAVHVPLS